MCSKRGGLYVVCTNKPSRRVSIEVVQKTDTPGEAFAFLCRCARMPHSDTPSQPTTLGEPTDWGRIYRLAQYHAVTPMVFMAQLQQGNDVEPWAHEYLHVTHARSQFLISELKRILGVLDDAGLRALPFKGPVFTHQAFPDLRYRFSSDLDLLIAPGDLGAITSLLKRIGYEPVEAQSAVKRRLRTLIHSQHTFRRGRAVFFLDVHTRAMPPLYAYAPDFNGLWERACEVDLVGDVVRCMAPVDRLIMLCFQGVKNRWDRLKYVSDVAASLHADPVDGIELLEKARSLASERALLLGTALAHDLLEVPLPEIIMDRIQETKAVCALRDRIRRALTHHVEHAMTSFRDRAIFQLRIQDSTGPRIRYIAFAGFRKLVDLATSSER